MLRRRVLAVLLLVLPVMAQDKGGDPRNFDASAFGQRVELGPNWLFAPGDNPAYASPAFDDSGWKVLSNSKQLIDYGYNDLSFCWYRMHIRFRPAEKDMVVEIQHEDWAYQLFVNGVMIGGNGDMSKHGLQRQSSLASYPIPNSLLAKSGGNLVLAIRCSLIPFHTYGAPMYEYTGVFLASREAALRDSSYRAAHIVTVGAVLASISLLVGLVSLSLHVALRNRREYLAAAIFLLANSAHSLLSIRDRLTTESILGDCFGDAFHGFATVGLIEFIRITLHLPRSRWFLALEITGFFVEFLQGVDIYTAGDGVANAHFLTTLFIQTVLLCLLLRGWTRGNRDSRLLLPAMAFFSFAYLSQVSSHLAQLAHLIKQPATYVSIGWGSYLISIDSLSRLASYLTILLFIVLRTIRIARDRAKVASEIEAAQTVQQLLLARSAEPTSGFEVESVYQPASETGGDFFLVSPGSDDSLVAIVGDVSGKGLTAAMRVSLIIGVLRRETSREPSEILRRLNIALLMQSEMGFRRQ